MDFNIFLAEMLLIEKAIKRHITMPPQITCASALPGRRRNTKIAFSLKCCISALLEFNQLFDVFNLFDSRLIPTMLYDSQNHVISAFNPQGWWGHGSGERKSRALQELDSVARTVHQCAVFWVSYFTRYSRITREVRWKNKASPDFLLSQ